MKKQSFSDLEMALLLTGLSAGLGTGVYSAASRRFGDLKMEPRKLLGVDSPESYMKAKNKLIEELQRGREEKDEDKIVDIDDITEKKKAASVKKAKTEWKNPLMSTILLSALAGGYYAGHGGAAKMQGMLADQEKEEARKEFERALLKERISAMESGNKDEMQSIFKGASMVKASAEDEGGSESILESLGKLFTGSFKKLAPYYAQYGLPAALLAGAAAHTYAKNLSPKRRKWRQSQRELQEAIKNTPSMAYLKDRELTESEEEEIRNRFESIISGDE